MRRGEFPSFNLEAIAPVSATHRFDQISPDGEAAGLPLPQDMEVLVQQQLRIRPEFHGRATQQDAIPASRRPRAEMQRAIQGAFDYVYVVD